MKNLNKAILEVMKSIDGIEKNTTVGYGKSSYKGVTDQDVKKAFKKALIDAELVIVPTAIEESTELTTWQETYNGQPKQKQSIFTKVKTKYLLIHSSGESVELVGYGHGVDSQDKGAGKSTTYALKNCLLYTFLTPVGDMDDTDLTHSNDIEAPQQVRLHSDAIERSITVTEVNEVWDGTILDDEVVVLNGKKIRPPHAQIKKLKAILESKKIN